MKKNIAFALLTAFCATAFVACKDQKAFTFSGRIDNPGNLKKLYLMDADSSQLITIDSVTLNDNGKFKLKHSTTHKALFKILVGNTMFDFIAKNGDEIEFRTDYADTSNKYEIKNSEESEKIKEFNKLSNHYINITDDISNQYSTQLKKYGKEKADSLLAIFMPKFEQNMAEAGDKTLEFGRKYQNSLIGFFAMKTLDRRKYEQQLVAYADGIKGKFPQDFAVNSFIAGMMAVKPVSIGQPAPDFTIPGMDDKPVKLADYKGKYVMLDFWASWCAPCRKENPNVVKLYAKFKDKGLNILGISLDTEKAPWQKAIDQDKLNWKHASELKNFESPVVHLYQVEEIPSNFIIDPQGKIIAKNITGSQLEDFLNKTFSKPQ